jgi:DNA-binding transcriptional MerR regulator
VSTYRIAELASRTGVPPSTLRFYEQAGLLPARRTSANYRLFDEAAAARLEFIGSAKLLGLPLEEIRELLEVWEQGVCGRVRRQLQPLVAARIAEAQRRIAELSAFADRLAAVHEELGGPAPTQACGPGCGCVPAEPSAARGAPGAVLVELTDPRPAERVPGGAR